MKKILTLILALMIGGAAQCVAQGQLTRPSSRTSSKKESAKPVTVSDPDGYINGHGYVDLGLPSGLKWATCNVGATKPEGYGDYFAWGETKPKASYDIEDNIIQYKPITTLKSTGVINSSGNLTKDFDAASINWESTWRMPTKVEFEELVEHCSWKFRQGGFIFTGPNGKSIFLPSTGRKSEKKRYGAGEAYIYYWTSSVYSSAGAYSIINKVDMNWSYRSEGNSIRPVSE